MIRIVSLAALAATLALAVPASAQSIRISTIGKSPDQVQAEVRKAAFSLCARATAGSTFPIDEMRACLKQTVAKTYERAAIATPTKVAQR